MPTCPTFSEFAQNTTSYAQLSAVLQKAYDHARKYYDQDMKRYERQEDLLRGIRDHITTHVSAAKRYLLKPSMSVREWVVKLRDDTKPSDQYMRKKALEQYREAMKGFKQAKINQWLDRWELAMKVAERHKIQPTIDGEWLRDLADAIRPTSDSLYDKLSDQAIDPEKSALSEYPKVALYLREKLGGQSKKSGPSGTMRGSAFNADFAGEPEEGIPTTQEGGGNAGQQGRKRAGTKSIEEQTPTGKKAKKSQCPACELKGHNLENCWYLFESKRPEDFKVSKMRMEKTLKRVEKDNELAAQVKELREKEEQSEAA